ncbi:MAG: helix-hairpin-helix domain-containing protein [Planctomycetota bacterium]
MYPTASKKEARQAFEIFGHIPGVGKSLSVDLWELGFRSMEQLATGQPAEMFEKTRQLAGGTMDRCVLYVYRCAVAYANNPDLDPELKKWWNWKDQP